MGELLLATQNKGKLQELRALLGDLGITLLAPDHLGLDLEVRESGRTYADNAARKATAYAQTSGHLTLADDSGLEVEALGGLPGIRSARFSPKPGATDADRRAYLLEQLQGQPRPWLASFRCTVALALPAGELRFARGSCQGEIVPEERGQGGFGYDPIFLIPSLGLTMAELTMAHKNRISHRARAVRACIPILTELINQIA